MEEEEGEEEEEEEEEDCVRVCVCALDTHFMLHKIFSAMGYF